MPPAIAAARGFKFTPNKDCKIVLSGQQALATPSLVCARQGTRTGPPKPGGRGRRQHGAWCCAPGCGRTAFAVIVHVIFVVVFHRDVFLAGSRVVFLD
jgi:hypothetical protein